VVRKVFTWKRIATFFGIDVSRLKMLFPYLTPFSFDALNRSMIKKNKKMSRMKDEINQN